MTPYMRGWVVQGLAQLIEDLGGDVARYEERFQLPLRGPDQSDMKIPGSPLIHLMEACAEDLECPDFGIRLASVQGRAPLGPVMLVLTQCATVGEAIGAAARFINMLNPAVELQCQNIPGGLRMSYQLKVPRVGIARQFEQWCLAAGVIILQILAGAKARPRATFFTHPPLLSKDFYSSTFGCPVQFSQAAFGLDFSAIDTARPMDGNDPEMKALVTDYLERIADASGLDLEHQLDALIRKLLPTGRCTLETLASHYFVSVRTLQRRLEDQGLAFEKQVDDIRRERAAQYLSDPMLRISQVALLLGYAEQSSLSHAFKRWYGMSPSAWRRAHSSPLPEG
ncbi:AraC family transcriptional regulator ligand-binding domain-containing protein [Pseudomonas sp. TH41]|uniref:AraC family transcriptional regulator n=1 Tax=Pseudomonas sp. TH41 TaxID=2796405 RepID=UPI0019147A60|nr:AraC family transcriptional regulator [Pseudomonas sp. TH41]MBK5356754.1 AraC family transcriptional regulator ligand-binding domain-containing protein [Pseudomonas sp. TH41]